MSQNGDWGEALRLQAPAHISYRLTLPAEPVELRSRIAMAPESWDWGGDGSDFQIQVQDQTSDTRTIYQRYVSNEESDRSAHQPLAPARVAPFFFSTYRGKKTNQAHILFLILCRTLFFFL